MAAGLLNFTPIPSPIFWPNLSPRISNHRVMFVKQTLNNSDMNWISPKQKPFSVRRDEILDISGASLAFLFRLATDAFVTGYSVKLVSANEIPDNQYAAGFAGFKFKESSKLGPRPEKPIEIYDHESCPSCRQVREIASILDLDVLYYPCPQNGPNFRLKAFEMGGLRHFPLMVDPNTWILLYDSFDIVEYLVERYGNGKVPLLLNLGPLTYLTEVYAVIGRKGFFYTPSRLPPKPLEMWAYEASPHCKLVREVLVELELPHILHIPKRQILYERLGHFKVPYLEDPNTGIQLFQSAGIIDYLRATYIL